MPPRNTHSKKAKRKESKQTLRSEAAASAAETEITTAAEEPVGGKRKKSVSKATGRKQRAIQPSSSDPPNDRSSKLFDLPSLEDGQPADNARAASEQSDDSNHEYQPDLPEQVYDGFDEDGDDLIFTDDRIAMVGVAKKTKTKNAKAWLGGTASVVSKVELLCASINKAKSGDPAGYDSLVSAIRSTVRGTVNVDEEIGKQSLARLLDTGAEQVVKVRRAKENRNYQGIHYPYSSPSYTKHDNNFDFPLEFVSDSEELQGSAASALPCAAWTFPWASLKDSDWLQPSRLEELVERIEYVVNGWYACTLGVPIGRDVKHAINATIFNDVVGPQSLLTPMFQSRGWRVSIPYISEDTKKHERFDAVVAQGYSFRERPSIPFDVDFYYYPPGKDHGSNSRILVAKRLVDDLAVWDSRLPKDFDAVLSKGKNKIRPSKEALEERELLMRYQIFKLSYIVSSPDKIRSLLRYIESRYGASTLESDPILQEQSATRDALPEDHTNAAGASTDEPDPILQEQSATRDNLSEDHTDAAGASTNESDPILQEQSAIRDTLSKDDAEVAEASTEKPKQRGTQLMYGIPQLLSFFRINSIFTEVRLAGSARWMTLYGMSSFYLGQVRTEDGRWLRTIQVAAQSAFDKNYDIADTLMAVAKKIDEVNILIGRGEEPTAICECAEEDRDKTTHPCCGCLKDVICSELSSKELCSKCEARTSEEGSPWERRFAEQVRGRVNAEFKARKLDPKGVSLSDLQEEAIQNLHQAQVEFEPNFQDGYTQETLKWTTEYSAFHPTVEAVLPFIQLDNGLIFSHVPGNLVVTAYWLNMGHHQYLPGCLQEIAKYCKSDKTEADKNALFKALRPLHLLGLTVLGPRNSQIGSLTKHKFASLRAQWTSGIIPDEAGLSKALDPQSLFRGSQRGTKWPCQFTETQKRVIFEICHEIVKEHKCEQSLIRMVDGSPWITQLGEAPKGWDWDLLWSFMNVRLLRMRQTCNRKHETVDTEFTLWLEIVFQATSDRETLFGLPMRLWASFVCGISLGHRRHGQQMHSGWLPEPRSLADRNESLCNIDIETTFENKCRFNFPEDDYRRIKEQIKLVQIPKDFYDPEAQLQEPVPESDQWTSNDIGTIEDEDEPDVPEEYRCSSIEDATLEDQQQWSEREHLLGNTRRPGNTSTSQLTLTDLENRIENAYTAKLKISSTTAPGRLKTPIFGDFSLPCMMDISSMNLDHKPRGSESHEASNDLLDALYKLYEITPSEDTYVPAAAHFFFWTSNDDGTSTINAPAKIKTALDKETTDFPCAEMPSGCKVVHAVYHETGNHWILVSFHVNGKEGHIEVRDSMRRDGERPELFNLARLISKNPKSPWHGVVWNTTIDKISCPRQANSTDCGHYAIDNLIRLLKGTMDPNPSPHRDADYGRALRQKHMEMVAWRAQVTDEEPHTGEGQPSSSAATLSAQSELPPDAAAEFRTFLNGHRVKLGEIFTNLCKANDPRDDTYIEEMVQELAELGAIIKTLKGQTVEKTGSVFTVSSSHDTYAIGTRIDEKVLRWTRAG